MARGDQLSRQWGVIETLISSHGRKSAAELVKEIDCHLRKDIRTFALDRVKMLRVTDESFKVPDDFSLEDCMGAAFGVVQGKAEHIKIWFAPETAGYIKEKNWHESQEVQRQRDGSVIFEAEVAVTEELVSWVMSWGAKAEVIGPESLLEGSTV